MSTITIKDLAGNDVTLLKINQDAYSGEYFKRVSNTEYRVKVRHTNEKVAAGKPAMARHNVDVTVTVYQSDGSAPIERQAYYILRQPLSETDTSFTNFVKNLQTLVSDENLSALIAWDTELTTE